jgi:SMI1 / KNR4 family (SUKH-1)
VAWEDTLRRIYWVQTELADLDTSREYGLVPNAPAGIDAINRAERRIGRPLPPSYCAFLLEQDGWSRFFDGASLLGTKDLGKASYADLAQAAFEAAETPIPDGGAPWSRVGGRPGDMIPFGIDPGGTTLFAFDPSATNAHGEMSVVAWIHEIGIRSATFPEFLGAILELCEADLAVHRAVRGAEKKAAPRSGVRARANRGERRQRKSARSRAVG